MKNEMQLLRERTGLTQSAFSRKFHIPLRTLQRWERGASVPVPYVTYMISRILDFEEGKEGKK